MPYTAFFSLAVAASAATGSHRLVVDVAVTSYDIFAFDSADCSGAPVASESLAGNAEAEFFFNATQPDVCVRVAEVADVAIVSHALTVDGVSRALWASVSFFCQSLCPFEERFPEGSTLSE